MNPINKILGVTTAKPINSETHNQNHHPQHNQESERGEKIRERVKGRENKREEKEKARGLRDVGEEERKSRESETLGKKIVF